MTQRTLPPPAYGITEPIPDGFPDGPILPYAFGSIMVGFQVFSDDHRVAQWPVSWLIVTVPITEVGHHLHHRGATMTVGRWDLDVTDQP